MARSTLVHDLFGVAHALIGVIHVPALPGTPRSERSVDEIVDIAAGEAERLHAAGFHGLMIENMHDRPYLRRDVGPEITAAMAVIGTAVRQAAPLPLGVQVLAGANREAIAVAQACGAAFVRVEGYVFAHVADEGIFESQAGELLRYRRAIGADGVKIFADVKKKHSAHAITADVDLASTAHAAEFFLADALVVTGTETGRPTDPDDLAAVRAAVELPVVVGSGLSAESLARYAEADAWIVGSWLKRGGLWSEPLDLDRVGRMGEAAARLSG